MSERERDWIRVLANVLFAGATIVLLLALIAGVSIAGSQCAVPGVDEIQRESRGAIAFAVIAFGIVSSAVLAALGAIIRLLLARLGATATSSPPATE